MESRYIFNRLSIEAVTNQKAKYNYILDVLKVGNVHTSGNYKYIISEVKEFNFNEKDFISGYLVKFKQNDSEDTIDIKTATIQQEEIENKIKAKSKFFIDSESSIIIFKEISGQISTSLFQEHFKKIFEDGHEKIDTYMVNIELLQINEKHKFSTELRSFEVIKSIKFVSKPSNPHNADEWRKTDERLKKIRATKVTETIESSKEVGLNPDSEIKAKISMAEDGYGSASATGIKNGVTKKISTETNAPSEAFSNKEDMNDTGIMQDIFKKLKDIIERTR